MAMSDSLIKCEINNLNSYLRKTNAIPDSVKVLQNVGEFSHIIKFPQFNNYNVTLTLQIPAEGSITNSNVIVNFSKDQKQNEVNEDIKEKIESFIKVKDQDAVLEYFFKESFNLISSSFGKHDENESTKKVLKTKKEPKKNETETKLNEKPNENESTIKFLKTKKESKKNETESKVNEKPNENEKKCPMKTAADVVHRIQWDSEINQEFIVVGYLDRFLGIKECEFTKFDWGDIVLADIGALAIPEHRINYFKYKNELVWDKNQRLDNIFGSTGSDKTIHEVIKRLDGVPYTYNANEEDEQDAQLKSYSKKKLELPNYFISIPINDHEIKLNISKLNSDLLSTNRDLDDLLHPEESFHITFCTLKIDTLDEFNNITEILETLKNDSNFTKHLPLNLNFKSVDNFYDKVFYVKCNCEIEKLREMHEYLLKKFTESKVNIAGNYYDLVPHLTIFKLKEKYVDKSMNHVSSCVHHTILKKYEDFNFGVQKINEFHLCKMVNVLTCRTYPVEYTIKIE